MVNTSWQSICSLEHSTCLSQGEHPPEDQVFPLGSHRQGPFPRSAADLHSRPLQSPCTLCSFHIGLEIQGPPLILPVSSVVFSFRAILAILFCPCCRPIYLIPSFFLSWALYLVLGCLRSKNKGGALPTLLKFLALSLLWDWSALAVLCLTLCYNFCFFCTCVLKADLYESCINTSC